MSKSSDKAPIECLLGEADWLRGLARHLARDAADADDLVQETWVAAIRSPAPAAHASMRPWLAQVLRNVRRMRLRGATRRSLRESEASVNAPGEAASTEAMLSRLELQRLVAGLVRDLDEPYRTTLLLRFFEGRTSAEIAAGLGVPAGTVRWRLNEGLRRLRARLDEAHDGNRATWALLALPAAPPPRELASPSTSPAPPLAEIGPRKLAWISSGVLVPVLAGGLLLFERSPRPPIAAVEQPPVQQGLPPEESREMIQNKARMSTLFGVVVPALIASADAAAAPERYPHEKVTACVPADNAAGCIDRLARAQLPRAVETELKRVEAGRKLDKLRIEPRLRKGNETFSIKFEANGLDEQYDFGADGTFIESEIELALADLPAIVARAAQAAFPQGILKGAEFHNEGAVSFYERENGVPIGPLRHRAGSVFYQVRVLVDGRPYDVEIDDSGKVMKTKPR